MMENFVDPSRFIGTIYHAGNRQLIGNTKGYQRIRHGYSNVRQTPKLVLQITPARERLFHCYQLPHFRNNMSQEHQEWGLLLPQCDLFPVSSKQSMTLVAPRGGNTLFMSPAIAAGAILCWMRGEEGNFLLGSKLITKKARDRFDCRFSCRQNSVPSESTIRDVLIRIAPVELDRALQQWNGQIWCNRRQSGDRWQNHAQCR